MTIPAIAVRVAAAGCGWGISSKGLLEDDGPLVWLACSPEVTLFDDTPPRVSAPTSL